MRHDPASFLGLENYEREREKKTYSKQHNFPGKAVIYLHEIHPRGTSAGGKTNRQELASESGPESLQGVLRASRRTQFRDNHWPGNVRCRHGSRNAHSRANSCGQDGLGGRDKFFLFFDPMLGHLGDATGDIGPMSRHGEGNIG